jgi:cell division protease FtsH
MVCEWGMSQNMGPLTFGKKEEQIFLGKELAQHKDYSEATAIMIDQEVKRIVQDSYERARQIILQNKEPLQRVAEALLEREVLEADEVARLVRGDELEPFTSRQAMHEAVREAERKAERKEERRRAVKESPISSDPLKNPGQA